MGNETNAGGFERAEGNIGEELGAGSGGKVDGGTVVLGIVVAEKVDGLLLEEFVAAKLEGALEEVTGEGGADTSQKSTGALFLDDLAETADKASVVGDGVKLNSCFDAESFVRPRMRIRWDGAYTSTGVRPPWVTEQQTAPAKAWSKSATAHKGLERMRVRIWSRGQRQRASWVRWPEQRRCRQRSSQRQPLCVWMWV